MCGAHVQMVPTRATVAQSRNSFAQFA